MREAFALTISAALVAACSLTSPYERPATELPQQWRDAPTQGVAAPADRWWTLFGDAALDQLVTEALTYNQDIALAVARVEEAAALARIADAERLPVVDATAQGLRSRSSLVTDIALPPGTPAHQTNYRATVNVFYELDFWGRLRQASAAARADLLATQAARDTVRISLGAQVAQSYFALRAFDEQIEATKRALALRTRAQDLQRKRADAGIISEFSLHQLEAEVASARAQLPALERSRSTAELALSVLLGRHPRAIIEEGVTRAQGDDVAPPPAPVVPGGLPSELLLRRPDLYEAEQRLFAANARIAVARAFLFPQISLTGSFGTESASLSNLFTGPAGVWLVGAQLAQPVFQGGRNLAEVDAAKARERQALAQYQKTVQTAFREVREALIAQARAREVYDAEGDRVAALRKALTLSVARYEAGVANQLEAIDAERNLLSAELNRIDALRAQRAAVADLFRALGGGWTAPASDAR